MYISPGTNRDISSYGKSDSARRNQGGNRGQSDALKKSDHLADLFNNYSDKEDEKKHARVRLSRASRSLSHHFQEEVHHFLKQEKAVAKAIEAITLAEEDSPQPMQRNLTMRKLTAYWQWLQTKDSLEEGQELQEEEGNPFQSLHQLGKDQEIKELYANDEKRHREVLEERQKSHPNYYYLVFPETYSFN
jgi:hypothetical protein